MANRFFENKALASSQICIFISYSSPDKPFARLIAKTLSDLNVDIYFDEQDQCLHSVAGDRDIRVVQCIAQGLDRSSHLLGVITEKTKGSWWVPYEIGGAAGRKRPCAHIVSAEVRTLPSFIKAGKVLIDEWDLTAWVAGVKGTQRELLQEAVRKSVAASTNQALLASNRNSSPITYYDAA